ncbi:MAG: 50S ribosomal protein L11 methyltransferase [Limnobacter sp.]|jgi:ribosomal protein L11 methyltransferase|uniref:50S ribosomal protein L11 methyltransferase n=1 Tax=unclassified Limnobacter TaxID=2630203 RepID=UPI00061EE3F5|nr:MULTISPECIES: 50S ribosomal protein L11 methyltransferase [unclassified Limnobacter]KJR41996.1 50S ribosomal protein L11 methyltransferase [Candidatus Magnetoovum chiemensis]MAG80403.1 50S ribosomal protein L11 methyltransferase [Sutterellaceae bacterium]MBA4314725.1 50S ribosomal protein L11 methyltransferase [Alcaligenaceae bacterium]PZO14049.1 MAG: 50S ribosomal protein L11 methyltransferase [Betaproteobacteria bacterium]MBT84954.1 50S ribosomal protein L11 methyltransferase [Sutterellac|tara:strand:- start:5617 stop:6531 length:915 start_codon:yes stop_codon:yes gene_type:complete
MNPQATPLIQAKLTLPFEQADEVSDLLMELGALAVSLEDANADSEDEQPLFGEPGMEPESAAWNLNHVVALFRNKAEGEQIFGEIPAELLGDAEIDYTEVPQEDWVRLTQSQFDPIPISARLWIVPSWHEPQDIDDRINLVLDPGLAFGTGSHPTTALCLRWLSEFPLKGQSVLDYGCGSGILGIAALKLGASEAIGVDIDPQAVDSTAYNAGNNGVEMPCGLPDFPLAKRQFPVVVANILSNPLKVLAPSLCNHVEAGGQLVLSGVLARQAEEVIAHYRQWIKLAVWAERDGWVCLHGQKAAD